MYISHKHKFIYFAPTKVASNAVAIIFTSLFEAENMRPDKVMPGYCDNHHSIFLPEKYKDYFLISSVRNPFERELSKYNYLTSELNRDASERKKLFWLLGEDGKVINFEKYIDWVVDEKLEGIWHRRDAWKYSLTDQIFRSPVYEGCVPITKIDKILKCENLESDILSIDFVNESNLKHKVKEICDKKYNISLEKRATYFPNSCVEKYSKRFSEDFINFDYSNEVPEKIKEGFEEEKKEEIKSRIRNFTFNNREITYIEANQHFL